MATQIELNTRTTKSCQRTRILVHDDGHVLLWMSWFKQDAREELVEGSSIVGGDFDMSHYFIWHRARRSLLLILHEQIERDIAIEEGLWHGEDSQGTEPVIHGVRLRSHPLRVENALFLFFIVVKHLVRGVLFGCIQFDVWDRKRWIGGVGCESHSEALDSAGKRFESGPVEHGVAKGVHCALDRSLKTHTHEKGRRSLYLLFFAGSFWQSDFQVKWEEGLETFDWQLKLCQGWVIESIFVFQCNPDEARDVDDFRGVVEEQLLVEVGKLVFLDAN